MWWTEEAYNDVQLSFVESNETFADGVTNFMIPFSKHFSISELGFEYSDLIVAHFDPSSKLVLLASPAPKDAQHVIVRLVDGKCVAVDTNNDPSPFLKTLESSQIQALQDDLEISRGCFVLETSEHKPTELLAKLDASGMPRYYETAGLGNSSIKVSFHSQIENIINKHGGCLLYSLNPYTRSCIPLVRLHAEP